MLFYVATPYSKYKDGIDAAFQEAARACAALIRRGYAVFSPITHSHPIAVHGDIDPLDHVIWMDLDRHMMVAAHGLIVVMMDGWTSSKGVLAEIDEFRAMGKPIKWLSWPGLEEVQYD